MLADSLSLSGLKIHNNISVYFSKENAKVWELSLNKKQTFIKKYHQFIAQDYIDGFHALEFDSKEIPTLDRLNFCIEATGWKVVYVEGYLRQNDYGQFLSQKVVPISRYMRSLEHLNYAPGPDMLHDIFGHLPMLFSPSYSNYLYALGKIMSRTYANSLENALYHLHINLADAHEEFGGDHPQTLEIEKEIKKVEHSIDKSPSMYTLLGRFFIWTIEFGVLLNHEKKPQMYGAGLLSSEDEAILFCEGKTKTVPFTKAATRIDFDFSSFQKQLFFAESYQSLSDQLEFLVAQS